MEPYLSEKSLMFPSGGVEEDFNRIYAGYYPASRFTALARIGEGWYAAGNDEKGRIHLFSSGDGGTWSEMETEASYGSVRRKDYGEIIAIFPGELAGELLLIGSTGVAVTVPDCPHCIEAARFSDTSVTEATLEDGVIRWKTPAGEEGRASLEDLARHRVSLHWVRKHEAIMIDLRRGEEAEQFRIPESVPVPEPMFAAFLQKVPRNTYLALLDDEAAGADRAAKQARKAGWPNCRSMGCIRGILFPGGNHY